MKKILTMLLLFSASLPGMAQHMLIEKHNNNNEVIELENLKEITFSGITVNIEQKDGTKSSNTMSAISSISFGDYTAIEQVKPNRGELVTYVTADEIAINGKVGDAIIIFNVVGTQILSAHLDAECGKISIANLPKGIYIIKVGNRTAKIVKR